MSLNLAVSFVEQFNTKYYYVVGVGLTERMFWFTTPPEVGPDVPYTFGLIGNLSSIAKKKKRNLINFSSCQVFKTFN